MTGSAIELQGVKHSSVVQKSPCSTTKRYKNSDQVVVQSIADLTPWRMDRRVLLGIFLVVGFLTGSFLFNWPPTQVLYLRSGAYSWLCNEDQNSWFSTVNTNLLSDAKILDMSCDEQIQAVDSLMPTGVASTFVFAFVGGLAVDYLGPRISALMGLTFQMSGLILLLFCSQHIPLYPLANLLMGFGNDPMYLSLLDCANLFPGYKGVVIAILSASRSLSFALPSIFGVLLTSYPNTITLHTIYLVYLGVLSCCLIVVLLVFPRSCVSHIEQLQEFEKQDKSIFQFVLNSRDRTKQFDLVSDNQSLATHCGLNDFSFFSSTSAGSNYSLSREFRPSRALPSRQPTGLNSSFGSFNASTTSLTIPSQQSTSGPSNPTLESRTFQSISSVVNSGLYLPLLPIAATTILSSTFFANSSREQLGSALSMFVVLNPLSFISGVAMGYLADRYGPLLVMYLMNLFGLLQFTLLLFEDVFIVIPYLAAFVSFLVFSFFLTQFYCYVGLLFPGPHFGLLSGFVVMCSGLLSLVVTPMCDFSSFAQNYVPMNGLCLGLTAANLIFLYSIYKNQGSLFISPQKLSLKASPATPAAVLERTCSHKEILDVKIVV